MPNISSSSLKVLSQSVADAGIVSTLIENFEGTGYCCVCNCQYCTGSSARGLSSSSVGCRSRPRTRPQGAPPPAS